MLNLKCPQCGNTRAFRVTITTAAELDIADEENFSTDGNTGDHEWDEDSTCSCRFCQAHGTVLDFSPPLSINDLLHRVAQGQDMARHAQRILAQPKIKVQILWGNTHEPDDEPKEYEFATQELHDAFMEGIEEGEGWTSYKVIEEGEFAFDPDDGHEHDFSLDAEVGTDVPGAVMCSKCGTLSVEDPDDDYEDEDEWEDD